MYLSSYSPICYGWLWNIHFMVFGVTTSIYFWVTLSSGVSLCSGMSWAIWAPNTHTHLNNTNLKLGPNIAQDNLCARVSYTYFEEEYLLGDFTKNIMKNSTEIHEIYEIFCSKSWSKMHIQNAIKSFIITGNYCIQKNSGKSFSIIADFN